MRASNINNNAVPADLSFEQTISKNLVHKKSIENVYCTAMKKLSKDEFLVGAYIPKSNVFLAQCPEPVDSNLLLFIEIVRQGGIALSHQFFHMPFDMFFVLNAFHIEFIGTNSNNLVQGNEITIRFVAQDKAYNKKNDIDFLNAFFEINRDNVAIASGDTKCSYHDRRRYQRIRSISRKRIDSRATQEVMIDSHKVVASKERNYNHVIGKISQYESSRFECELIIDKNHIFFFEHSCDHVPGTLMIEGVKQFACRAVEQKLSLPANSTRAMSLKLDMQSFGELYYRTIIIADLADIRTNTESSKIEGIKMTVLQNQLTLALGELGIIKKTP